MLHLAIIADDLTGALDAAAPFSAVAGGVIAATSPRALPQALATRPGVVTVSTRSREVAPDIAGKRVRDVLAILPSGTRIFKKIDSRLKGNIIAELAAFGPRPMLVCPATPDLGRVVQNGALSGLGVDVPIDIASRLGGQKNARIPDAETIDEMAAEIAQRSSADTLLVGARGLAQAQARHMALAPVSAPVPLPAPLCIAIGSTDPITMIQIATLRAQRPDIAVYVAPAGRLSARQPVEMTGTTVIQLTPGTFASREEAATTFAGSVAPWVSSARAALLTGGATAEAVLDALGIETLTVHGEVLPGLPSCKSGPLTIITKSGGFGAPDALVQLAPATQNHAEQNQKA